MTPLEQYPALRQALYTAQWIANLAIGVIGIVLAALQVTPLWSTITVAALSFVWTYTGTVATRNVRATPEEK